MASTSNPYEITDYIKQDLGRTANRIARRVAEIAMDDLEQAHQSIMQSFYAGYTPVKSYTFSYNKNGQRWFGIANGYRRKGNLMKNSKIPLGVKPIGTNGFQAILSVGPEKMQDYRNSSGRVFPAEGVFDVMWNYGYRGLPPYKTSEIGDPRMPINFSDYNRPPYRGFVEEYSIDANPFGIHLNDRFPDEDMKIFIDEWGAKRGNKIIDSIVKKM